MNESVQILSMRMACVLVPTLAVLGFQRVIAEPRGAFASDASFGFVSLPDVSGVVVDDHVTDGVDEIVGSSPLWFVEIEHQLAEMTQIEKPKNVGAVPDPVFVLSAVLPSRTKPLAVVNGKPHRAGDVVVPGWRLKSIDGASRSIVMEHDSGRVVRVSMSQ